MRVAIINHGIFPFMMGGMERHTHLLAKHMAEAGVDVEVIIPELEGRQAEEAARLDIPYKLVQLPWPTTRLWLYSNYLFSKNARDYLAQGSYDAVYCQGFNGWAYLAQPRSRRSFTLFNPHGLEMFKTVGAWQTAKHFPMRWAARLQARHADKTVSLGGGLTDEVRRFLKVADSRIETLPNAVDIDYVDGFQGGARAEPDTTEPTFIFVGRLEFNKGVSFLCEAFEGVERGRLSIVGGGGLEAELKSRFESDRIRFLGKLGDQALFELYATGDCFVFGSLYEGMPTVILEAMASGLPVIATDIGAVKSMVDPETGFVVQPGSAAELRGAIDAFLRLSLPERKAMSKAARSRVEALFTWPRIARLTIEAIERGKGARS